MEWWLALLLIFGGLILLMTTGMPVAFCFMLVILIAAPLIWAGDPGLLQVILGLANSVVRFSLLPLPLFILMGEVLYHSGLAPSMIDAIDKWLGRLPGRLGLLAVGAGTLFSTLTGTSMASVAMLGGTLVPEMERRGYRKPMSLGPILGSGGLAMMIPPSGLAVLYCALAEVSIGQTLIAIIIPGLMMAALYTCYIVIRCKLEPSLAPPYESPHVPISEKLISAAVYILPAGFIVFLVVGVILLGISTPTEAAATGAMGSFLLALAHRRLNWEMVKKSMLSTLEISSMIFFIIVGSKVFSQILAFSGATEGLAEYAISLPVVSILVIIVMQFVLLILGMFMSVAAIMMITIPLFVPVVDLLGFNLVWFGVIYLLNMEMGSTTPPFGLSLFVMKGVAPPDTTMGEIYRAAFPFLVCDLIAMILIIIFPAMVLWLPSVMR